jgi:hypothetical protein
MLVEPNAGRTAQPFDDSAFAEDYRRGCEKFLKSIRHVAPLPRLRCGYRLRAMHHHPGQRQCPYLDGGLVPYVRVSE